MEDLIANSSYKIPKKNQKEKLLQGTKREENQKVTKEIQNVKGMMNSGTGKAISHRGAKFYAFLLSLLLLLLSFRFRSTMLSSTRILRVWTYSTTWH